MSEVSMTSSEPEEFLADLHVGVMSIDQPGGPPLTFPIWYDHVAGGEIKILTSTTSTKGRLLSLAGAFSMCVQDEVRPYRYASVEGRVTEVRQADTETDLRPTARRYLGGSGGDDYTDNVPPRPGSDGLLEATRTGESHRIPVLGFLGHA